MRPGTDVGMRAALRSLFGTDEEMKIESRRRFDKATKAIDEMAASSERLRAIDVPAMDIDQALQQMVARRRE